MKEYDERNREKADFREMTEDILGIILKEIITLSDNIMRIGNL